MNRKKAAIGVMLVLAVIVVTVVSARTAGVEPQRLSALAQQAVVGGDACGRALGVTLGLAVGALSPCSIICAVGAFYALAAMGAMAC
jgi:hypothetical protein